MVRARYQVLVIPYCIEDSNAQFCLFRRSDIGIWQFIAGLQRKQHRVKSRRFFKKPYRPAFPFREGIGYRCQPCFAAQFQSRN